MSSEQFPQLPPPPGANQAPTDPGFDPSLAVPLNQLEAVAPLTTADISDAVQAGVIGALEAQAAASEESRLRATRIASEAQRIAEGEARRAAVAKFAEAGKWVENEEAKRKTDIAASPGMSGSSRPTVMRSEIKRAGAMIVDGRIVAGHGVVGTADEAKVLREPHALNGPTEGLSSTQDAAGLSFNGLRGRLRRRRVGNLIGDALQLSRDIDVEREGAASVRHGRSAVPGLEANTGEQEASVRRAAKLVVRQGAAEATNRRNEYNLRAIVNNAGIKGAERLTGQELLDAVEAVQRPAADAKKVKRVDGKRLGKAQESFELSGHKLDMMEAGQSPRAQVKRRTMSDALGIAQHHIAKQSRKERKAAAEQRRQTEPGPRA